MNPPGIGLGLGLVLAIGPAAAAPAAGPTSRPTGVVVDEVEEGFAAHAVGFEAGDILLRWERAASPPQNPERAAGELSSPFDLEDVELEQAPRGELTLSGWRGTERLRMHIPPGRWRLHTRPRLTEPDLEDYRRARARMMNGELDAGLSRWSALATHLRTIGDRLAACWLFLKVARAAGAEHRWDIAETALAAAQSEAETLEQSTILAAVHDVAAGFFETRSELDRADAAYRRALEIRRANSKESLAVAQSLDQLGWLTMVRSDQAAAEALYSEALALREKLAPGSTAVARSLANLGSTAGNHGDRLAAETYLRRALAIIQEVAPQGLDAAMILGRLGVGARYHGDFAAAEDFSRRSLAIRQRLAPGSLELSINLTVLAGLALYRDHDPESARALLEQALDLRERAAPDGIWVAASLNNLGIVRLEQGDLKAAEALYRRALAIAEKLAPNTLHVAADLVGLGNLALKRDDLAEAEQHFRRSLEITEQQAPGGNENASVLGRLAAVARARGDFETAEALLHRALAIHRQWSPGTAREASICYRLAKLHRQKQEFDRARHFFDCAVDALGAHKSKLGGSDVSRSSFDAAHADIYREAIHLRIELDEPEAAFGLLESYRARELLSLLSQRELVFSADLPTDLERRRRGANQDYDQAIARLLRMSDRTPASERREAREALDRVRRRQEAIRAEIRIVSPRLAALQDPKSLDLSAAKEALDPGTLLLSYLVGEDAGHLFALGPGSNELRVVSLGRGQVALASDVERFRTMLQRGRFDRRSERAWLLARRLSLALLAPVADRIARAERLLILPDGPLHSLPFAALADPSVMNHRRFLIEAASLHHAASMTVYAWLAQQRGERRATRLAAFGDPRYPSSPAEEDTTLRILRFSGPGFALAPLPASRTEVENLGELYPQSSKIYLGPDATEGAVKSIRQETTHLHIASHGLLNDRFPLDSALALSIPFEWREGEDNGLLQAWEIFEQVRIDADLVTLSACDTARGQVLGGEGLIGLTRAFQYAGARSVLASLWSVGDASTAELMQRFYAYLKQGQTKADALRAAQLDLLRSSEHSHPFHWAGFQLVGDWR